MKRKIRRLRRDAEEAHRNGVHWEEGYHKVPAPGAGPLRIAFDAGREAEKARKVALAEYKQTGKRISLAMYGVNGMTLETWSLVLADYLWRL